MAFFVNTDIFSNLPDDKVDWIFGEVLPFPSKKKQSGTWWHTSIHPEHKGIQSGESPPMRFKKEIGKSFCWAVKKWLSLPEMVVYYYPQLKNPDKTEEIRKVAIFLGLLKDNDKLTVMPSIRSLATKPVGKIEDELLNKNLFSFFPEGTLKVVYDHPHFTEKRGFTKEFIDEFGISIATEKAFFRWYGRFIVPIFGYVPEPYNEHRLFGIEARRLTDDISPNVLYTGGSKVNRVLFGEYNLDKTKPLIVVEGIPDTAKIWAHITRNVTCLFTNSIFKDGIINQFNKLKQFPNIICFADNDDGGKLLEAQFESLEPFCNIKYAKLKVSKDPGEASIQELQDSLLHLIQGNWHDWKLQDNNK